MYQIDIYLSIFSKKDIKVVLAEKLGIDVSQIEDFKIIKKSIDARNKNNIRWLFRVQFKTEGKIKDESVIKINDKASPIINFTPLKCNKSVVIVGMGPAGIFCALSLALSGVRCVVIERGKPIEKRVKDVRHFLQTRELISDSNIQFGEGGAGTFSDGKLTARTKHPYYRFVIDEFIKAGAPEEISYLSKPHIGSDRLRKVIISLRKRLISLGVEIFFEERMDDILVKDGVLYGILTNKREIPTDFVVIATGYSARDTLRKLAERGVAIEAKGFAMGYRLELPQELINNAMFGKSKNNLPPAEFFFTKYFPHKSLSVYTFCMCPGGMVVPACSSPRELVLNGMSFYKRDGYFGNAAIVVSYNPEMWHNEKLGGLLLQEMVENKAFVAGGGNYDAPAITVTDFIRKKLSTALFHSSYPFRLKAYPLWDFYRERYDYFKEALQDFDKKLKGIVSNESLLIAPETRTSSPYRITRDEHFMSKTIKNLFPCGEGAGYAGGIITSAIDGLKVAEKIKEIL